MVRPLGLPFDPIVRAGESWEQRFGPAAAMRAATSVFRVQQILLARFDEALRPHGLTFARYEVLVLLTFSRAGLLPLKVIGSRLMVHPTSVTNAIDRLAEAERETLYELLKRVRLGAGDVADPQEVVAVDAG